MSKLIRNYSLRTLYNRVYKLDKDYKLIDKKIQNLGNGATSTVKEIKVLGAKVENLGTKVEDLEHRTEYLNSTIDNLHSRLDNLADQIYDLKMK